MRLRLTREQYQRLDACTSLNQLTSISAFIREAIDEAASDCLDEPIFR